MINLIKALHRKLIHLKLVVRKFRSKYFRYIRVLHIEFTSRCNINCKACYRSGIMKKYMDTNTDMSLENLKKLLDHYKKGQLQSIIFSGGENLLHPNFFDAVELCRQKYPNADILLSTNGVVLSNRDLLDRLCKSSVTNLQVSLHGATQETINLLQKGIRLPEILEAISYLTKNSNIEISFNYVIQEENIKEMLSFVDLVATTPITNISFTPINFAGHSLEEIDYTELWKMWGLKNLLLEASAHANQFGIQTNSSVTPICTSIFEIDVVSANGTMGPCWGNFLVKKYNMGNIFHENPRELRNRPEFKEFARGVKSGNTGELCKACWANGKYSL